MNAIQKARAFSTSIVSSREEPRGQTPRVFQPPLGGAAYFSQAYKWEEVTHYKGWVAACIGASIREVAGSEAPHIGRIFAREIDGKGRIKRKSWNPVKKALGGPKQHEEFEPYDDDHPIVQVFRRPNDHYVAYDLWAYHMLFKGLTGEAHWWVIRNRFRVPVEIWVIPTHWMRLETGRWGEPIQYAVQSPWGQLQYVPYEDVVSFRDHSPLNIYEGAALLQIGSEWIDSYEAQVRARLAMFKNGGAPSFHVLLGESYADPDEAFLARFYAKWMQRFQGENNWGKPVVTGPDVEVKTLGVAPDEIPFKDGEEMGRDEICALYGTPKGVLGIEPSTDVSAYAPQRQYVRFRINPELKYIGEIVTEKIVRATPNHEDGAFFFDDHVINDPEQQRADINMRWEKGAISPNQIRVLYGDEPWEHGGDDPVLNGAPVPWGTGKKDQEGTDLDRALRAQLGRQDGEQYGLDQLDDGTWTVNDADGHVLVGPFKTEELARVGMSKLQAKDAKEGDSDSSADDGHEDIDAPVIAGDDDPPVDKDIDDGPPAPLLRWYKTPHGDLEARGHRKWRIERSKDRKSGRITYRLHLDEKPHDSAGALGILKEVAEKVEKDHARKALGESSMAGGGALVPDEEMKLGANGVVAKALLSHQRLLEDAIDKRFGRLEMSLLALSRPSSQPPVEIHNHPAPTTTHIVNKVPTQHVVVKNEVNPTPVTVDNRIEPTPVTVENTVHVDPTPITVENNVETTPVHIDNNVSVNPTPVTVENEVNVPAPVVNVHPRDVKKAKREQDGTWVLE